MPFWINKRIRTNVVSIECLLASTNKVYRWVLIVLTRSLIYANCHSRTFEVCAKHAKDKLHGKTGECVCPLMIIELLSRAVHAPIRTLITERVFCHPDTLWNQYWYDRRVPFITAIVCAARCTGLTSELNSTSRWITMTIFADASK